jgi:hypothetical protein
MSMDSINALPAAEFSGSTSAMMQMAILPRVFAMVAVHNSPTPQLPANSAHEREVGGGCGVFRFFLDKTSC